MRVNYVTVTAAQKIIKNSNHSYVRNILHIKLVKITVDLKIRQNPAPAGLEKNKSGTALKHTFFRDLFMQISQILQQPAGMAMQKCRSHRMFELFYTGIDLYFRPVRYCTTPTKNCTSTKYIGLSPTCLLYTSPSPRD